MMKVDKHGKKPQVNYSILIGAIMAFSSLKPSTGPLTRIFSIVCGFGGAALCAAGGIQESKKWKNK
jgi:hypothetical protein